VSWVVFLNSSSALVAQQIGCPVAYRIARATLAPLLEPADCDRARPKVATPRPIAYPGWALGDTTAIAARRFAVSDLAYGLNVAFPWCRPTLGIGLYDGIDEIDGAFLRWAAHNDLVVDYPHRAQPDGTCSFDGVLADLAARADRATARVTAKMTEYPIPQLQLRGAAWPWRPTALLAAAVGASIAVGSLAVLIAVEIV
jgi:hypothetical protein